MEKRRLIGGIGEYGWLGHVAASGRFRKLLAHGSEENLAKIVRCINAVASITHPIRWRELESRLNELVRLGHSMKVWGRLLCILRPDLYCTVGSPSVRINLAATLAMPVTVFETPKGYVRLLQLIHSSPWFNSKKPFSEREAAVWERR